MHGTSPQESPPLIAVDIGNHRVKFGLFDLATAAPHASPDDSTDSLCRLPRPASELHVAYPSRHTLGAGRTPIADVARHDDASRKDPWPIVEHWLSEHARSVTAWMIGSVNRPATTWLVDHLRDRSPTVEMTLLGASDLLLDVDLSRPDMAGIDRLLDAVAGNAIRSAGRPMVVVDVGTAITVDVLSAEGAFQGGAILPGIAMAARAMHDYTDLLPLIEANDLLEPPPSIGDDTRSAMRSGLFWGAVGSIRELVARAGEVLDCSPEVIVTGGAGPAVAELLGDDATLVPHLTLAGIALTAEAMTTS